MTSFRDFWAWLNTKSVAPWVVGALAAAMAIGYWQHTVAAQGVEIERLEHVVVENRIESIDAGKMLREDLIQRLDRIDQKLDRTADTIDKVKEDVATLCKGKCK